MRLPATSMIESITAMVIILLSFSVGMMIYMNILRSEKIVSKTKANLVLNQLLDKTLQEELFFDDKIQVENLWVERSVVEYQDFENAYALKLEAFNSQGESIFLIKEIIFKNTLP